MRPGDRQGVSVVGRAVVGLAGAITACTRAMAPTGSPGIDVVESAAVGAFAAAAALWCPWWVLLAAAAAGVAVAPTWTVAAVAAGAGLAALGVGIDRREQDRRLSASLRGVAGVGIVFVFTRLRTPGFHGGPSLVAGGLFALLVAVAAARSRRLGRLSFMVVAVAVGAGLSTGALAIAGLGARTDVTAARDAVQRALDQVRAGDFDSAKSTLKEATTNFARAEHRLRSWSTWPSSLVPVVGRHRQAILAITESGVGLGGGVGRTLGALRLDRLRPRAGRVDLTELERLSPSLETSHASIARMRAILDETVNDGWIVSPFRRRLVPLQQRATRASRDSETAVLASRAGRTLLGANEQRRYLVLFITPAEARGLGGFAGNFAELSATDGQLAITRFGRSIDLFPKTNPSGIRLKGPPGWAESWARFGGISPINGQMLQDYWLVITQPPDLADVGALVAEIYPQVGGAAVDGVIAIDPQGLSALLALTGPVNIPSIGRTLDAISATEFLLRTQYRDFVTNDTRVDALANVARATTEALLGAAVTLPAPPDLARVLSPAARANHLTMWSRRPDEQALLHRVGADNALPVVESDTLGVVFQSGSASKLDAFVTRSIEYDATVASNTGAVTGTVAVTMRNDATPTGLPPYAYGNLPLRGLAPYGEHALYVTVYTAYPVTDAQIEVASTPVWRWLEHGRNATTALVTIPPGRTGRVTFTMEGFLPSGTNYRLAIRSQTSATTPDRYHVRVRGVHDGLLEFDRAIEGVDTSRAQLR